MELERKNKLYEYKSLVSSVKDVDKKSGIVTGYFAAFDNIDSYGDMIVKGAFKKTIVERGPLGTKQIKHLFQHDTYTPIGRVDVLKEDKTGLYFETTFSQTQQAQDVLTQYAEGIYNEHSIGYRTMKEERVDDGNGNFVCWKLTEVKLWEGSTVTWGANANTPFTGFKSEVKEDRIAEISKRMHKCISILKLDLSEELLEQTQIELVKLDEAYKSLVTEQPRERTDQPTREQKLKGLADLLTIK